MNLNDANAIWGKEWTGDIEFIKLVIQHINLPKDSKILDVGTGFGIMAISLAVAGYDVLTGEPGESHEEFQTHLGHEFPDWRASAKSFKVGNKISYRSFDAQDLPFPSGSYDGVFLYDALQHIDERETALNECLRVTKRGGVLCVTETNDRGIEYYLKTEGFRIDKVDPRGWIEEAATGTEILEGQLVNAYILRKR